MPFISSCLSNEHKSKLQPVAANMTISTSNTTSDGQSHSTGQISASSSGPKASKAPTATPTSSGAQTTSQPSSYLSSSSSPAFQQVKQTQASLARLLRVHQQLGQTNQSSQLQASKESSQQQTQVSSTTATVAASAAAAQTKSTTFVDCLIRRFKDCFSEDFCTVPVFVVGNLSPGSDGTHLILPPCISLGGQSIGRFSSPKNLRLMNSIRESCRSVEELDLGGNKLTDLIEVYKILQCTPNLRFLNLSENDLSRSSPVAMATLTTNVSSTASIYPNSSSTATSSPGHVGQSNPGHWTYSSTALNNSNSVSNRAFLAQINQNQQAIGARRHSTLGQPAASTFSNLSIGQSMRARQVTSRVAEARRLAAAAAVAQSKKTSSSVASKLTNSASAGGPCLSRKTSCSRSSLVDASQSSQVVDKANRCPPSSSRRYPAGAASTMHLARSLSSLSAKDVRAASSSMSRLSAHRSSARNETSLRSSTCQRQRSSASSRPQTNEPTTGNKQQMVPSNKSTSRKLFVEPIDESDDIDMSEQQLSPNCPQETETAVSSSNIGNPTRPISIPTSSSSHQSRMAFGQFTTPSQSSAANHRRTFESIKALALNNTGCPWRVVCSILSRMPNLEELHLSLNNYERIDLDPNEFKHHSLKRLYLCNNPRLTNWDELDKLLSAFPSLEALSIADCSINQIPDNLDRTQWRKLRGLNINGWPIKEWPVIERLNQLPSLVDLKCQNVEILNTIDEPRHHIIARLPKLQRLNGSEIEEREHAEKAFLCFFMANSHLERPARFHELIQIHGEVVPKVNVDVDLSPPSQAHVRVVYLNRNYRKENEDDILMSEDFLIKLMDNVEEPTAVAQSTNLDNMEFADSTSSSVAASFGSKDVEAESEGKPVTLFKDEGQEVVAIDVDLRQSVRKFKSTLSTIFGLSSQNMILYYIDHEMVGLMGPELIKHNQKKLWNYNVQNGDQFIVEER